MDISEYLPSVVGSIMLMLSCWFLGRFEYSILWILLLVVITTVKSKLWKDRQRRIIALQHAAMKEKEVVLAQLKDLPAWVQFPDTERVEWLNKVIYQLWPYIGEYSTKFIKEIVEPQVKSHMPRMLKSFRFEEIDIGDIPLRVSGIKVYTENVGRDRIIMDMDVAYAGDCEFAVAVGAFKGGLRQMQFKGKLRAVLSPLIPRPPMVGGVSAFFLDAPAIDFDLTGLGEFVELPLLMTTVRSVVNEQLSSICVLPNQIVVPLTTDTNVVAMYFQEPDGVLRIRCLEASKLENRDNVLQGKSDPFARISVGAQSFRTKTIDNSLEPIWNETFDAVVDQPSGQKLIVEVFDDDIGHNDDFLGQLAIDIEAVREKGAIDTWYTLEGVKHGNLHLSLYWLNLSKNVLSNDQQRVGATNHALLMIYVDSVSNLPSSKSNFEPSPYLAISLGNDVQKTFPRPKTHNPLFRQKFIFFVSNFEQQKLRFEARDETNNDKSLGEYELDLRRLSKESDLEMFQQTADLTLGPHNAQLVFSARLRFLEQVKLKTNTSADIAAVDNPNPTGVHIISNFEKNISNATQSPWYADQGCLQQLHKDDSSAGTLRLRKLKRQALIDQYVGDLGEIELEMQYRTNSNRLNVLILGARNLKSINKQGLICPYISAKLLINGKIFTRKKTAIFKNTSDPRFGENFDFNLDSKDYEAATLVLDVKDASQSSWILETPVIGQVLLDMAKLKIVEPVSSWFRLNAPCYFRDSKVSKASAFQ